MFYAVFYVASVAVNVLVANTHRNVHFIAWGTVSALHARVFLIYANTPRQCERRETDA